MATISLKEFTGGKPVTPIGNETNAEFKESYFDNSWKGDLKQGWQGALQSLDEGMDMAADASVRPTLGGKTLGALGAGFRFAGDALGSLGGGVFRALPGGTTASDAMGSAMSGVADIVKNAPGAKSVTEAYGSLPQPVRQTIGDVGNIALGGAGIAGALTVPTVSKIGAGTLKKTGKTIASNAPDIITKDVNALRAAKVTQGYMEQNTRLKSVGDAFAKNTKTITTPEGLKTTITPVDTLAKYNIAPDVDKGTILMGDYAQSTGALGKIRNTVETIDDELDTLIQGNTQGVPLDTLKQKIFDAVEKDDTLRRSAKVASTKAKMESVFDDYKASYGDTLSESEINEIRKLMNKDWNPDTMDTSRLIGDAARDIVYNITPDKKAKALLQEQGNLLSAKKYAEKINGTKVVGGRLGNYAMRTAGAILGTTFDKVPVVGPMVGMLGGEYAARALQQSQFKSIGAEAKALLQRSNKNQPTQSANITPSSASMPTVKPQYNFPSTKLSTAERQPVSSPNSTTRPVNVAKEEINKIKDSIAFREAMLDEFPHSSAKNLMRYYKNGDYSLSEVNYRNLGAGRKSSQLDSHVTELGFKDMDEAQDAIDKYIAERDSVAQSKRYLRQLQKEVRKGEDMVTYDTGEYLGETLDDAERLKIVRNLTKERGAFGTPSDEWLLAQAKRKLIKTPNDAKLKAFVAEKELKESGITKGVYVKNPFTGKLIKSIDAPTKKDIMEAIDYIKSDTYNHGKQVSLEALAEKFGIPLNAGKRKVLEYARLLLDKTKTTETLPATYTRKSLYNSRMPAKK